MGVRDGLACEPEMHLVGRKPWIRFAWVTAAPLAWLAVVTTTASWQKIFSPDVRLGFLAAADQLAANLTTGVLGEERAAVAPQLIFNLRLDAVLALLLTAILWIVIADTVRLGWRVSRGLPVPPSSEAPAVRVASDIKLEA